MRKFAVGSLCWLFMAVLMAHMGHTFLTWEFWAGMSLMVAYGANRGLD